MFAWRSSFQRTQSPSNCVVLEGWSRDCRHFRRDAAKLHLLAVRRFVEDRTEVPQRWLAARTRLDGARQRVTSGTCNLLVLRCFDSFWSRKDPEVVADLAVIGLSLVIQEFAFLLHGFTRPAET